jgi:methyl-accepting chemotaxis protein
MPYRIKVLDKIISELTDLAQRANEIEELQLANTIVEAAATARESRDRIERGLEEIESTRSNPP